VGSRQPQGSVDAVSSAAEGPRRRRS
jgi:hypothetical protein